MGINTYDVLEAAGTKWNFLKFQPGLVGGHCIGVDPYYLTYKSIQMGFEPQIILSGRKINDGMSAWVAKKVVQLLLNIDKNPKNCKVLIMGATFKENVSDIRNSKIFDLYKELQEYGVNIDIVDPYAEAEEVFQEYGVKLSSDIGNEYNAIIVAVNHLAYSELDETFFKSISSENGILVDLKNLFKGRIVDLKHWTL